jgi:quinol monooxygenase YgiN
VKLVILISTQAGRGQEQVDVFKKLAPLVRNEEGGLQYDRRPICFDWAMGVEK